jgi:soluble lytic murein transglycosylase-like protein
VGLAGLAVLVGADPQAVSLLSRSASPSAPLALPVEAAAALPPPAFEADILRSCELAASTATLREEAMDDRSARVLLGLASHNCDAPEQAVALLDVPSLPSADLEDWRLYSLAEAANEAGAAEIARAAADVLLADHPDSPLRNHAAVLRSRIALDSGEPAEALELARTARAATLPEDARIELDAVAWEAALALDSPDAMRAEAHRLQLYAPLEALELGVAEAFAARGGLEWSRAFTAAELSERAERLVELDLLEDAFETLDAVPKGDRDRLWHVVRARALVDDKRGIEAYRLLEGVEAGDPDQDLELSWLRAQAALDAATVRRGRQNLSSTERDDMRAIGRANLRDIAARDGSPGILVPALRRLFEELVEGGDLEEIEPVLRRLSSLDARDFTGARWIWRLGWDKYVARSYTEAIAYWSELERLYSWTTFARSGRYWTARSVEALGDSERARSMLEQIAAAPSTDYYRRHALVRLGRDADESPPAPSAAPRTWPTDPVLSRAARLSDLGIDRLGMMELDLVSAEASAPAADALRSRILARQGLRRDSIQSIWRVFPILGTADQMEVPADALLMYYPLDFLDVVERFAADNRLPVQLLLAMIRQESAFDVRARSWAGASGLMQIMPGTGRELAQRMGIPYSRERLDEPSYSVQLGSRYFRQMLDMFDGNLELALAAYNAGPYRIRKMAAAAGPGLEPDRFLEGLQIEESKTYVKRVVLFSSSYRQLYPELG